MNTCGTSSAVLGSFAFGGSQLGYEEYGTGDRVFEWAVPAAALVFTPYLLLMHYASRPVGFVARQFARARLVHPRTAYRTPPAHRPHRRVSR